MTDHENQEIAEHVLYPNTLDVREPMTAFHVWCVNHGWENYADELDEAIEAYSRYDRNQEPLLLEVG